MEQIGIDFGARHAGTTVICRHERGIFQFHRCAKGEDADAWLEAEVSTMAPEAIYIDAPLSLPGAYFGRGDDHFFRRADRLTGGMSPMFLGGLTARAMRMADQWRSRGIAVFEVYPAALIRSEWEHLKITPGKAIPPHKLRLMAGSFALPPPEPRDRHEADAWLCWISGHRHRSGQAKAIGDQEEGMIFL